MLKLTLMSLSAMAVIVAALFGGTWFESNGERGLEACLNEVTSRGGRVDGMKVVAFRSGVNYPRGQVDERQVIDTQLDGFSLGPLGTRCRLTTADESKWLIVVKPPWMPFFIPK